MTETIVIRQTMFTLVNEFGVSQKKVNGVMKSVVQRLPGRHSVGFLVLVSYHFHRHFQSSKITSDNITYSLALSEVVRGDPKTLFETFQDKLS
ncbi:hypothetical protein MAR_036860 [Mya arenaria]|uniref:Uncharacterized protein n=1 Tax=Mya arenaria TaxID=6604 RepID=A0ABY7FQJ8_MYAAR|nr:hypothetical protein MAR_036860 [Mya arenaria]